MNARTVAIALAVQLMACGRGDEPAPGMTPEPTHGPGAPDLGEGPPDFTTNGAIDLASAGMHDLGAPADLATRADDLAAPPTDLATTDLSLPPRDLAVPPPDLAVSPPDLATPTPDLAAPLPDLAMAPPDLALPPRDLAMAPRDLAMPPPPDGGVATVPVIIPRTNIDASGVGGAQTGADVAIDPTNTPFFNHLLAASDDASTDQVSVYETNDGATTWRTHKLLAPLGTFTGPTRQPTVAYDSQGNGLVSMFAFDAGGANSIAVARRRAGAGSFDRPVVVPGTAGDRHRLAIDRAASSPRRDTVYLAWSDGAGSVQVASSTDGGVTFGAGVRVNDDGGGLTSPYVTTAADGTVYVAWLDTGRGQLRVDRSLDGGASWGTDHVLHTLTASGASAPTIAAPQSGARLAPFCDVDRSTGARKGTIFCVYTDATVDSGLDVFLRRSSDGGATWSAPRRMNDDPSGVAADQFLPRVQVDDGNAKVSVAWYDTRDDAAHEKTNVYFTRANDGSAFVASVRITSASTDESGPGASPKGYGESLGMEAFLGRVRVVWTDSRTGDEDLFSCIIDFAHFDFFIAGSDTITVPPGGSGQMAVTVQPVGPYTSSTTLSLLDLPAGATATWSSDPVAPNDSSTVTVTGGTAAPGTYVVGLHGAGGGESDTRNITVVIQ